LVLCLTGPGHPALAAKKVTVFDPAGSEDTYPHGINDLAAVTG
jgi:hypothetical protein